MKMVYRCLGEKAGGGRVGEKKLLTLSLRTKTYPAQHASSYGTAPVIKSLSVMNRYEAPLSMNLRPERSRCTRLKKNRRFIS